MLSNTWFSRAGLLAAGLAVFHWMAGGPSLLGQSPAAPPTPRAQNSSASSKPRRTAVAKYTDEKITVDGRMNEPAWQTAEVSIGFTQQDPVEGTPSSELTEVRVLYNKDMLYFGVFCH